MKNRFKVTRIMVEGSSVALNATVSASSVDRAVYLLLCNWVEKDYRAVELVTGDQGDLLATVVPCDDLTDDVHAVVVKAGGEVDRYRVEYENTLFGKDIRVIKLDGVPERRALAV